MMIKNLSKKFLPRFGIQGSGLKFEAKHYWRNWTAPVNNWVCGYYPITSTVIFDCIPEVKKILEKWHNNWIKFRIKSHAGGKDSLLARLSHLEWLELRKNRDLLDVMEELATAIQKISAMIDMNIQVRIRNVLITWSTISGICAASSLIPHYKLTLAQVTYTLPSKLSHKSCD